MFVIGICDDEIIYQEQMKLLCLNLLSDVGELSFALFSTGDELLESDVKMDALFLDIEMSGMDGIRVKDILEDRKDKTRIIFMTSHDERMREAFGTNVVDFIIKPIKQEEAEKAIRKLIKFLQRQFIEISVDGSNIIVPLDEILYIESEDKYTYIHTQDNKYLVRQTLSDWEEKLPSPYFCRCSRFCIINMEFFDQKKQKAVVGNQSIPVGRTYKRGILETYLEFLRRKAE